MKDLLALGRFFWVYRWRILLGLFALVLVDLAMLCMPLVVRHVVDQLASGTATSSSLLQGGLWFLGLGLVIGVMRLLWRFGFFTAARLAEMDLRRSLYDHWLKMGPSFFHKNSTGDLMAHATNDVEAVRFALAIGMVVAFDAFAYTVFTMAAMLIMQPQLTLKVLAPFPLILVAVLFYRAKVDKLFVRVQEAFSDLSETIREGLAGVRVIKSFAAEKQFEARLEKANEEHIEANIRQANLWGMFFPLTGMLGGMALALLLWLGGPQVINGQVSLGDFVALSAYLAMLGWPMMAIGWTVTTVQRGLVGMRRLRLMLETQPVDPDPPQARSGQPLGELESRNLTFAYQSENRPALYDISFLLKPGQTLGLVGKVGSGKSTLLRLILRLEEPGRDSLFLDGSPVQEWSRAALRQGVGYVSQQAILFSESLRDNIRFGAPNATAKAVDDVVSLAGLEEDLRQLPQGLDTLVGERGVTLSGGQKQRVALARALLLDTPVLLLDDTLSAVDAETETRILDALRQRVKDRTLVVASNRLSAVREADHILVLDKGRIIQQGTHQSLAEQDGLYRTLWQLQSLSSTGESS